MYLENKGKIQIRSLPLNKNIKKYLFALDYYVININRGGGGRPDLIFPYIREGVKNWVKSSYVINE